MACCRALLDHRRILLCRLIERVDALVDFRCLYLLGGTCRALGELANLLGNDGETLAGFPRASSLDARIQRQEVGLEGDVIDHADDIGDLAGRLLDLPHRRHGIAHHKARLLGAVVRLGNQLSCFARSEARIVDRGRDFFQRRGRLLDRGRLLFRPLGEGIRRGPDLPRASCNSLRVLAKGLQRFEKSRNRRIEVMPQLLHRRHERRIDRLGKVAFEKSAEHFPQLADGAHAQRDVGCDLDDLVDLAVGIGDRIVDCLDPDLPAPFREAPVDPGIVLAPPKASPQLAILRCRGVGGLTKQTVMLAGVSGRL